MERVNLIREKGKGVEISQLFFRSSIVLVQSPSDLREFVIQNILTAICENSLPKIYMLFIFLLWHSIYIAGSGGGWRGRGRERECDTG